ncbi:MAG: hypothetical protein EA394_01555 [Bacteroidia bacterium]|nr:MAG: hypothetical protein EA394_01555 [Bacteroidia bacterium]
MQQVSAPDIIGPSKPEACSCGHRFTNESTVSAEKRQVFDLLQFNEPTITPASEKCYEKLQKSENIIKSEILSSKVAYADETGARGRR